MKPLISKFNDLEKGSAKWNELFIFEVPHKVLFYEFLEHVFSYVNFVLDPFVSLFFFFFGVCVWCGVGKD